MKHTRRDQRESFTDYMSAKDAHNQSKRNAVYNSKPKLDEIFAAIQDAVVKGLFAIYWKEKTLHRDVYSKLESLGYKVSYHNDARDPTDYHYTISWQ